MCTLAFIVVALCLAEVQRRSLVNDIGEFIQRQGQAYRDEAERIRAEVSEQGKLIAEMQSAVGALRVLTKDGRFSSSEDVGHAIDNRLQEGKKIVIRFDSSNLESRDPKGAILCGPDAENGYLGVFVAGEEYAIRFDSATHQWIGSGPAQNKTYDGTTSSCMIQTAAYGPAELHEIVLPGGILVLWGARLKMSGLQVFLSGHKVGRVVWVD